MHAELRLLAIAGPPVVPVRELVEACVAAERGGVTAVQLRIKGAPAATMLETAMRLRARLTIPLWINDRADVALAAGARGVHVGSEDVPPDSVRAFAGTALAIGVSVGDTAEAATARSAPVDYWSIGAIYRTGTKADAGEPIGTEGLRRLAALAPADMPVIAIGGITEATLSEVLGVGAHGVAVSHAVFASGDPAAAALRLRRVIDAHGSG